MRTLSTEPSPAADTAAPVARGTRAPLLQRRPEEYVRWLQRTAGNRATATLMQRSCACAGSHEACEHCQREGGEGAAQAAQHPLARHRAGGLDQQLGAQFRA